MMTEHELRAALKSANEGETVTIRGNVVVNAPVDLRRGVSLSLPPGASLHFPNPKPYEASPMGTAA